MQKQHAFYYYCVDSSPQAVCVNSLRSIRFNCIITPNFITKIFVDMLIAVFTFSFFTQPLLLNVFFFFTTSQVVLYRSNAQELDNKSVGFNRSPAKSKLIRRNAYLALAEDWEKSHRYPANCTLSKHKTKIGQTIIAKTFQLPLRGSNIITSKIAENWLCD